MIKKKKKYALIFQKKYTYETNKTAKYSISISHCNININGTAKFDKNRLNFRLETKRFRRYYKSNT